MQVASKTITNHWNKFNKMKNMYSENHMIFIKYIDKDKNTWKDMLVLDLKELVFENVNTTQKLLKIQGDFQ